MSNDPKIARLRALSAFKSADKHALEHLATAADEVTVDAGHVLISQGHHHNEAYVIESGTAEVEIDGSVVAEIPAGELIGELGYFTQTAASATVRSKTEVSLLVIPYNRFGQILDENPKLLKSIAVHLAERLVATDAKLH